MIIISHTATKIKAEIKRGGDKEVFDNYSFVCATAKRINNKEERIKNNNGVRSAERSPRGALRPGGPIPPPHRPLFKRQDSRCPPRRGRSPRGWTRRTLVRKTT